MLPSLLAENLGFLPTRGSFMLDFVFVAMFIVMVVMAVSIYMVRYRQAYQLHKTLQISLALILLVAVTAFEVDVQFISHNWKDQVNLSQYSELAFTSLYVHLAFAIPTPLLWAWVIIQGLRRFPRPVQPNEHSRQHIFWARIAAVMMAMTSITGWTFYILGFVM